MECLVHVQFRAFLVKGGLPSGALHFFVTALEIIVIAIYIAFSLLPHILQIASSCFLILYKIYITTHPDLVFEIRVANVFLLKILNLGITEILHCDQYVLEHT